MGKEKRGYSLNDAPRLCSGEDEFDFNNRIVKNIFNFLQRGMTPCIISITGPLGGGK